MSGKNQSKQVIAALQPPPAAGGVTSQSHSVTPPPQFNPPNPDAYEHPDTPIWRSEYSYRGGAYRYLNHQRGIIGYVKVRVVAARDLCPRSMRQASKDTISPAVEVRFLDNSMRTATATRNSDPTWRKEQMIFQLDKGCNLSDGLPVCGYIEVFDMTSTLASSFKLTASNNSLGRGRVDITPLLKGEEGHAVVLNTWVELSTRGKVHLIIEYEPNGEDPQVNDVVYLESFARQPRSLIIPPYEPFVVKAVAGSFLLLSFKTQSSAASASDHQASASSSTDATVLKTWEGQIRVHRNNVFVIERLTLMDGLYRVALKPTDILLNTTPGSWVVKQVRPLTSYSRLFLTPAILSFQVAVGAARIAVKSAVAGVSSASSTAFGREHRF